MPKVYNWQIGREMAFPYEEAHPEWQFAAIFNTNRCIGCQTCTMACKSTWTFSKGQEHMWWNNVETKPYGGYPMFWDIKLLRRLVEAHEKQGVKMRWDITKRDGNGRPYGVYEGMTIFEAAEKVYHPWGHQRALGYLPKDEEWRTPNLYEDTSPTYKGDDLGISREGVRLPEHKTWFFYLQRICNHCSYPACLAACPRKAIYKRKEDGVVLIDQRRCRGYKKCIEACPYKKPMFRGTTRTAEKCIACYPRIEGKDPMSDGKPMEARCMTACIGKIRLQGMVRVDPKTGDWVEDRYNPIYFLVKVERVALPLYPQFGTQPNIYYIPPRWVPRPYLRQMFGPGVDEAIERYTYPSRELLAVLQLFRATQTILFRYEIIPGRKVYETKVHGKPWVMYDDTVIGYDRGGNEVVRLSVLEPFHKRPAKHLNSI